MGMVMVMVVMGGAQVEFNSPSADSEAAHRKRTKTPDNSSCHGEMMNP
jgi:hypothetical protein